MFIKLLNDDLKNIERNHEKALAVLRSYSDFINELREIERRGLLPQNNIDLNDLDAEAEAAEAKEKNAE